MQKFDKVSFSKGEIHPRLAGRVDQSLYYAGAKTARNTVVEQFGGITSRNGTRFIAPIGDHAKKGRLVSFEFGTTDTHLLLFEENKIRVFRNDANVLETAVNISGVTQADPCVITTGASHGYTTGDEVFIQSVGGMTELNSRRFKVTVLSATTFSLQDQEDGTTDVDSSAYTAYTSGGTVSKIYEVATPFTEQELPLLQFSQSFDVLFIAVGSHKRYKLSRLALDNWQIEALRAAPDQAEPTSLTSLFTGSGSGATYRYAVTAVSEDTGEESLAALHNSVSYTITNITAANPPVVTFSSAPSNLQTGDEIYINSVGGMTEINDRRYRVVEVTSTTYQLQGVDASGFTAYTSGGTAKPAFTTANGAATLSGSDKVTVSWAAAPNAIRYIVYKEDNGVFGYIGETTNTSFVDDGSKTVDTSDDAPFYRDPFFGSASYPAAIGEHQQRTVYGGSSRNPSGIEVSQTGAFENFNRSVNYRQSDAFSLTLDGRANAQVRHFVSLTNLIVFLNNSVKMLRTGDSAFALENIRVENQSQVGASWTKPLVVSQNLVFEEENGERVHAGRFEFTVDGVALTDLSLLSSHILEGTRIREWTFVPWPQPVIHAVQENGKAFALTYNPEAQADITGWCTWDTEGDFESVTALKPAPSDKQKSAYFIVKRLINGRFVRYVEKYTHTPATLDTQAEDVFYLDSGATYDNPITITGVSLADPCVITAPAHGLSDGDFIDIRDIKWQPTLDEHFNATQPDQLNGRRYRVENSTTDTLELRKIEGDLALEDSSAFREYVSGGVIRKAVTSISGLRHLANTEVVVLQDGAVERGLTVSADGVLTLPSGKRASRIHVGLQYLADIETLPVSSEDRRIGNVLGNSKRITQVHAELAQSRGVRFGPNALQLREWKQRELEAYGEATRLFSGTLSINIYNSWNKQGTVFLRQADPLPMTVLRLSPETEISTR